MQEATNGSLNVLVEGLDVRIQGVNRHLVAKLLDNGHQNTGVLAHSVPRDARPSHLHLGYIQATSR